MKNIANSFISDYEFIKNANNDIISAVYPMQKHLAVEMNDRMILGGSLELGGSRFNELGIPAGLYLEPKKNTIVNGCENINIIIKTKQSVIDDELFDKLLGVVSSVKPHSGTRKNREKKQNRTKQNN